MAETFVRFIKLGGGMAGKTKDLNGVRFVNGIAKVRMSDEDFAKVIVPSMARFMAAMLEGFDEEEKRVFASLLERFRQNAEAFDAKSLD